MDPIDWPHIIRSLVAGGLTQPQIAVACQCGQSTVSDMLNGKTTDARTSLGRRLLGLAKHRGIEVPDLVPELVTAEHPAPQEAARATA